MTRAAQNTRYICTVCGLCRPVQQMVSTGARVPALCRVCYEKGDRANHRGLVADCPHCGVPAAEHWTCARCSSRGHLTGRGTTHAQLCAWCEDEVVKGRKK